LGWAGCAWRESDLIYPQKARHFLKIKYRWANEVCANDSEERAITIAAMNEIAYILQIWLPLLVWQQVDAPKYFKGYVTVSCMSVLLIAMSFVVRRLHNKEMAAKTVLAQQEHATESCVQLYPRAIMMDDGNSSAIQLGQFTKNGSNCNEHEVVSLSSASLSNEEKCAPSPTTITTIGGSTIVASPCEKGSSSSKNSILQSPATDSSDEIETCPTKLV
jgi:MFS transporter, ACS family, pantothenate transporter